MEGQHFDCIIIFHFSFIFYTLFAGRLQVMWLLLVEKLFVILYHQSIRPDEGLSSLRFIGFTHMNVLFVIVLEKTVVDDSLDIFERVECYA